MLEADERYRVYIRLGRGRRDRKLAASISADRARGVNVSKLIKELLYNYYTGAAQPTHTSPVEQVVSDEARQSALSAKLRKLNFDNLMR